MEAALGRAQLADLKAQTSITPPCKHFRKLGIHRLQSTIVTMRLIKVASLEMQDFFADDSTPKYAILSHTWGKEGVTFQDFKDLPSIQHKEGWSKIENAVRLTQEDGLDYLWVDTCCIDKTSSAELQEAINSMYRWYEDSAVCYAFLRDLRCPRMTDSWFIPDSVSAQVTRHQSPASQESQSTLDEFSDSSDPEIITDAIIKDGTERARDNALLNDEFFSEKQATKQIVEPKTPSSSLSKHLTHSRWFTRGWTLQELVAPRAIRFFDRDYKFVGEKGELSETIMLRTGIDDLLLKGHGFMSRFSVAQRMSWAAGRQTSRIEDRAYSLLGIFGVNMPMIYGEGANAFERLQEEIIKASDDDSIFAWESLETYRHRIPLLLALSPDNFLHAGNIVVGARPESFELTNGGLRIEVLLRKAFTLEEFGDREYAALLNCHFKDDKSGTLALRLFEPETSDHFDLTVGREWNRLAFDTCPWLEENSRLAFVSASNMATCERRRIQIARRPRPWHGVIFKLNLLSGANFPCNARIVKAYPSTGWDADNRVLRSTSWDRIRAGTVYECQSGVRLAVVFGYDYLAETHFSQSRSPNRKLTRHLRIWAHHYHSDLELFAQFCDSHAGGYHTARDLGTVDSRSLLGVNTVFTARTLDASEEETMACRISMPEQDVFVVQVEITKLCELSSVPL